MGKQLMWWYNVPYIIVEPEYKLAYSNMKLEIKFINVEVDDGKKQEHAPIAVDGTGQLDGAQQLAGTSGRITK